jgi:nitrate/nitrite transporter NarK
MSVYTKVVRTFVFAFLGVFVPALANIVLDLSNTADWSVAKAALLSLIGAAFAAGLRAIVAFLPVFADDTVGIQKTPPGE